MDPGLEQLVRERAESKCEYCRMPQRFSRLQFVVDHVVARRHDGATIESNLALACPFCNSHKGPYIAGIDPQTKKMTRLFHPRQDNWEEHFRWNGHLLIGLTEMGRATIAVLAINHSASSHAKHADRRR